MSQYASPLRYPGGKSKLSGYIGLLLTENRLHDAHYVEPYAGGASVALTLLFGEHIAHAHINDIDPGIHAFWYSVLYNTDRLCRKVLETPLTMTEWRRQRAIHARGLRGSQLSLGFATLFLNRTNRSGIIHSGGPIGGVTQKGAWKLDARFPRDGLVDRIRTIAAYRDRITLHNADAVVLLRALLPTLPKRRFVYLDPPYYVKGQRRLYLNGYAHADHVNIAALMENQMRWMVSYDDVRPIRMIYRGYKAVRYKLSYSAGERVSGSEIAFVSPDVTLPRVKNPVSLRVGH